ncbi:DUF4440 domain-containing protein [Halobaculum sp. MBLA0147]|uniref:DUF4440 domain-containing protein n=1 Tax=Halobaculum sp. MBLA0147 TaxID=3079934 RepID=UPI003525CBF5
MTAAEDLAADATREVVRLHEWFQAWFRGEVPASEFGRVAAALQPTFRMVTPEGVERDREAVLDGVRAGHGEDADGEPPFVIRVRDTRVRHATSDHCLVTYEEWQRRDGAWTGRRSTALFASEPSAPEGVGWRDLQETWIEERDEPPTADDDPAVPTLDPTVESAASGDQ